jgi:hypothetical protein
MTPFLRSRRASRLRFGAVVALVFLLLGFALPRSSESAAAESPVETELALESASRVSIVHHRRWQVPAYLVASGKRHHARSRELPQVFRPGHHLSNGLLAPLRC